MAAASSDREHRLYEADEGGNSCPPPGDYHCMDCDVYREAVSAQLDNEEPGLDAKILQHHLDRCPGCRSWQQAAAALARSVRVTPAETIPDITAPILAAAAAALRAPAPATTPGIGQRRSRAALALVALAQLAVAVPALLASAGSGAPAHLAHELGSWDLALAIGFLFAAWHPARAWGMLPLVAALVACLLTTTGIDMAEGHVALLRESTHALDLAGLALLWALARGSRPPSSHLRLA